MSLLHFLVNLFFLFLIFLLIVGYLFVGLFSVRYMFQVFVGLKRFSFSKATFSLFRPLRFFTRKRVLILLGLCLQLTVGLYLFERFRWFSEQTVYRQAREYMVTAMVLRDFRVMGARVKVPEHWIWKPLVWLQEEVMSRGMVYIPETDGERGIWEYYGTLAPYISRMHRPYSQDVYSLINSSRQVLRDLATKPMADQELVDKDRYLLFSLSIFYYQYIFNGQYTVVPSPDSYHKGYYKDPQEYHYLQQLVDWSVLLEKEWSNHPQVGEYMQSHPRMELSHIVGVCRLLHEILEYKIQNILFSCDDRYLDLYYHYRRWYEGKGSPRWKVPRSLSNSMDLPVIWQGDILNFFGNRLCNRSKLSGFYFSDVGILDSYNHSWLRSFVLLNRKLVPPERQTEVLERFEKDPEKDIQTREVRPGAIVEDLKWLREQVRKILEEEEKQKQ